MAEASLWECPAALSRQDRPWEGTAGELEHCEDGHFDAVLPVHAHRRDLTEPATKGRLLVRRMQLLRWRGWRRWRVEMVAEARVRAEGATVRLAAVDLDKPQAASRVLEAQQRANVAAPVGVGAAVP